MATTLANRPPGGRTLNWAHRGASGHAPQNTIAAFTLAADMGADGIELDVRLSADGEAMVIHNQSVDDTTDGTGPVHRKTVAELKALDAGSWFDARFAGERVPTLAEAFDAVGERLWINVEVKVQPGHHPLEQEAKVVHLIEDRDLVERVIVSSFSPRSLRRVYTMNRHIPLGLLYARPLSSLSCLFRRWLGVPYRALHPHFSQVDVRRVGEAHRRGQWVNVWTVDAADDMRRMRDLGVDGIITNYPDRLRDVLAER
jgi:glycerophosphoryl diester phosphodiesterase